MVSDRQLAEFWEILSPEQRVQLMRDIGHDVEQERLKTALNRYQGEDGIIAFCHEQLGVKPYPYQEKILRALVKYKRVAVRSPHGAGKTAIAAWFVLWLMSVYEDVKIPTLAPTDRQTGFLWSEIRKWSKRLKNRDFRILQRRLDGDTKEAFGVSSSDASFIEGVHGRTVGYIFDEAKALSVPFFEAAEGAFSNADNESGFLGYWLAISTPGNPSGTFYDIHAKKAGLTDWHSTHVTIKDCIKAKSISKKWVEQRKNQWGVESAVYKNRVLAEFDESGEDNVIPLSWVEAAIERGYEMAKARRSGEEVSKYIGCDPARYGQDKTAIATLENKLILPILYYSKQDTMQTTGRLTSRFKREMPIAVDVIGVGAGVVDRLKELKYNVTAVNVAEAARDKRGKNLKDVTDTLEFANLRSWLWWHMRDRLNPDNEEAIGLPNDDKLIGDLTSPQYRYLSNGKIQVESKDDIRKRLKRSTDGADAVGLALWSAYKPDNEVIIKVVRYA